LEPAVVMDNSVMSNSATPDSATPDSVMPDAVTSAGIVVEKLVTTRWTFGELGKAPHSDIFCFARSGAIAFYDSPNEATWKIANGVLEIYRGDGQPMWRSVAWETGGPGVRIVLRSPFDLGLVYQLTETDRPRSWIGDADFLVPKDLQVTPTRLRRVLLVGGCLARIFAEDFASRCPETVIDHILFNHAQQMPEALPGPAAEYGLQLIQLPLNFVLTDRVIWANRFADPGFMNGIFDDACLIVDAMLESALRFNRTLGLFTFVSNFIVPQMSVSTHLTAVGGANDLAAVVRRLNDYLVGKIAGMDNVFLLDADALAGSVGKRYLLDDMIYHYSHSSLIYQDNIDRLGGLRSEPVPPLDEFYRSRCRDYLSAVFDHLIAKYRSVFQIDQVKAVVFDLDNTLWRGQIAEHYRPGQEGYHERNGWPTGIWEAVQHLRARGILVAICSKNDFRTVQDNWDIAVDPLFVQLSDFVSVKINWRPKSENILEICREFGLTPKSVVLVDDHPVEREAAKAALPDLRVIGSNPYLTRRILLWAPETQVAQLTNESIRREEMMRGQMVREDVRASLTRAEFLAGLESTVSFLAVQDSSQKECTRVLELVNKTNQFNTTGRRWSRAEMDAFFDKGGRIAAFRAKDRFADYGLIGAIFASGPEIVQLVMSCRVLGMDIEQYALAQVVKQLRAEFPGGRIGAVVRATGDNAVCRDIFVKSGFRLAGREETEVRFEIGPTDTLAEPAHVAMERWG
jgi:FkbH-like protein